MSVTTQHRMSAETNLKNLAERWGTAAPAERANFQSYLIELCMALNVEPPRPAGSGYEFEFPVTVVNRDGTETTNFVDLFKRDHFVLEAKDQGSNKPESQLLHRAYGQARAYAAAVVGTPPPYLLVLDVGKTLLIWDRWSGTYGGFQAAKRIDLSTLWSKPEDIALLRDIFQNPAARDPRARAAQVTRETAEKLAELAASLEGRGFEQEEVARFLMRCVFTMFAEDMELLPGEPFTTAVKEIGLADPDEFTTTVGELWRAMDRGERFGLRKFLRFNGHFFKDATVLPLTRHDLVVLEEAATAEWSDVEPTIMGTLLTRALDPAERHKLGAEYTPREYVERVVRPTVEEPVRERWTAVQADVLQLLDPTGKKERTQKEHRKQALDRLRAFHGWLCGLRFLDPACGSGNFLYVTLAIVKQIELEVLREIESITKAPELAVEEVGPWQFHGIEVKAWAREIAELTLWIGYHQWWRRTHGHTQPPEPVLRDTGTLEHRDAVLQWDEIVDVPEKARPDPTPRIPHPVTGELVPDPAAVIPYLEHQGARPAAWPDADFIIGNPPYLGSRRMRMVLGEGYTDALRAAYPEVPDGSDFVMLWWHKAAQAIAAGRTIRAGLITTNSITQAASRRVVAAAREHGVRVIWAVADHPWVDETNAASVRVAMTVLSAETVPARLVKVSDSGEVQSVTEAPELNLDLTADIDVPSAARNQLRANRGLAYMGVKLVGAGFILQEEEAERLLAADPRLGDVIKPYIAGRDLTQRPRKRYVIDFGLRTEEEAREYPTAYDIVRTRVKPERDANKERYRDVWWQFGVPNAERRRAAEGLARVIATVETSRHRFFTFIPTNYVPDGTLITIASDDAACLGVLSSSIHVHWALAAGGRLGVGNDARYSNGVTFAPFPFPASLDQLTDVRAVAEDLDEMRRTAIERDPHVTMSGIYGVIGKLHSGERLTARERAIHDSAGCGVLKDLHERLDKAVAAAYGWEWPLDREEVLRRLVELQRVRISEEAAGLIRWIRPDFQSDGYVAPEGPELELPEEPEAAAEDTTSLARWPDTAVEQISALQALLARQACTVEGAARRFAGARRDIVGRHLETLALMGEARIDESGTYHAVQKAG